jgi:hypothetical protein
MFVDEDMIGTTVTEKAVLVCLRVDLRVECRHFEAVNERMTE